MKNYESYISKGDVQKIHEKTLQILAEVGVNFEHEGALELFKRHGVKVEGETVFIHEGMLNELLGYAKKRFTVKSLKGDVHVGSGVQYNAAIAGNVYRHHFSGKIAKMTDQDTIDQFKLADTSDIINIATINYFLDYNKGFTLEQKLYGNLALIMKYSNKPMLMSGANTFILSDKKEISRAFRKSIELINQFEGSEDLHNVYIINPLSPLAYDHDPIDRIFTLAETGQGILFAPCAMPLMTAPPSMASMIAMTNAEVLAGYCLAKLINPEAIVVYGNTSGATDMRTVQLAIGAPECALVTYATVALADHYGLPSRTGGALSDAKDLDVQAGAESMMMITATQNAGADIVLHACGCMGSFNLSDFGKFLIDEEIQRMTKRLLSGIDCNEEKFCFDTLKKIGPRGTFLKGRTPKMYKEEVYLPEYFNKDDPNQWQNKGSISIAAVAEEEVKKRLERYEAPEITKEQNELILPYLKDEYKKRI